MRSQDVRGWGGQLGRPAWRPRPGKQRAAVECSVSLPASPCRSVAQLTRPCSKRSHRSQMQSPGPEVVPRRRAGSDGAPRWGQQARPWRAHAAPAEAAFLHEGWRPEHAACTAQLCARSQAEGRRPCRASTTETRPAQENGEQSKNTYSQSSLATQTPSYCTDLKIKDVTITRFFQLWASRKPLTLPTKPNSAFPVKVAPKPNSAAAEIGHYLKPVIRVYVK